LYSVEKTLKDLGEDKVTPQERENIKAAEDALRKAMEGDDIQAIKDRTEALSKALYDVTTRVYQQSGAQAGGDAQGTGGAGMGAAGGEKVVDAEFTEAEPQGGDAAQDDRKRA